MARRRSRGSRVSRKRSKISRKRSRVSRKRSRVSRTNRKRKSSRVSKKRSRVLRTNRKRKSSRVSRNKRGGADVRFPPIPGAERGSESWEEKERQERVEALEAKVEAAREAAKKREEELEKKEEAQGLPALDDGWYLRQSISSFNWDLMKWWEKVNTAISQYNRNITQIEELKTNIKENEFEYKRLEADFQRWESSVKDGVKFMKFLKQKEESFKELKDTVSRLAEKVYPPSNFYHTHLQRQLARYVEFNEYREALLSQIKDHVKKKHLSKNEDGEVVGIRWPFDSSHPESVKLQVPSAGFHAAFEFLKDERDRDEKMYVYTINMLDTLKRDIDVSLSRTQEEIEVIQSVVEACGDYLVHGNFESWKKKFTEYQSTFPDHPPEYIFSLILHQILGDLQKKKWFGREYNSLSEMASESANQTGVFFSKMARNEFQRSCEILKFLDDDGKIAGKFREVDIDLSDFLEKSAAAAEAAAAAAAEEAAAAKDESDRKKKKKEKSAADPAAADAKREMREAANQRAEAAAAAAAPASASPPATSGNPGVARLLRLALPPPPVAAAAAAAEGEGEGAPPPVAAAAAAAEGEGEGAPPPPTNWSEGTILKQREPDEGSEDIRVIFQNFKKPDYWNAPGPPETWFSGLYADGSVLDYDLLTKDYEEAEDEGEEEGEEGAAPPPLAAPPEEDPIEGNDLPDWESGTRLKEKSPDEGHEDIRVIFENFIETPEWAAGPYGTWFSGRYVYGDEEGDSRRVDPSAAFKTGEWAPTLPKWDEGTILKTKYAGDIKVIFKKFIEQDDPPAPYGSWFLGRYVGDDDEEGLYEFPTESYEKAEDAAEAAEEGEEGEDAAATVEGAEAPPVATVEGAEEEGEREDAEDASSRTRFGMMGRPDEIMEREWMEKKAAAEEAERLEKIAAANAAGKQEGKVTIYTPRGTKETKPTWLPPPNAYKKRN